MRLTKRGQTVLGVAFIVGLLAMMGVAGAIETQDMPTCSDYEASQNWEAAWDSGCPFQDNDGNYLYTWEAN
jgi:hypothetical protein